MPFPFTFKLAVPSNPFSAPPEADPQPSNIGNAPQSPEYSRSRPLAPVRPTNINQRRPSPSPSPSAPIPSRKRGWDPSLAEPSQPEMLRTSPNGYLDTPAKYREIAARQPSDEFELEDLSVSVSDLPPPTKRRRTLAGSIVSTAVSAALIGTAVGLTVYRLWRDRGKQIEQEPDSESQQIPPPPYQQGEWKPIQHPPQAIEITPPTPMITPRRRKVRHGTTVASTIRRQNHRQRPQALGQPSLSFSPSRPALGAVEDDSAGATVEDQMDWMGDQLSMLIKEGQKALRSEIVVQSDAKEDEVDDGSGGWEEEGGYSEFGRPSSYTGSLSRSASPRLRKRPRNLNFAPPSYASRPPSASPGATRLEFMSASLPSSSGAPRWSPDVRGVSADSEFGRTGSVRDDESSWESPELRESMAKARARAMAMRGAG